MTLIGASIGAFLALFSLQASPQDSRLDPRPFKPYFRKYCADCHLDGASKGGLDLDALATDLHDAETLRRWVRVYDRVRSGEMPPPKKEHAPAAEQDAFLKPLAATLTRGDLARRKVVFRRLNRAEYENTMRDLFGVHAEVRDLLPEDATLHGFDTMGEALAASAELVQAYLQAADIVLDAAYGSEKEPKRIQTRFPLAQDAKPHIGDLFRETPEGVALFATGWCPSIAKSFRPQDEGTYRIRIHAKAHQIDRPVTLAIHAGDVIVKRSAFHLVGHYDVPPGKMTVIEFTDRFRRYETFHPQPVGISLAKEKFEGPALVVGDIEVEGPLEAWPPPSRQILVGATMEDARAALDRLLPRAFRRTMAPTAVDPFLALVKKELDAGRPYREAIRVGIKAILVSPEFLFRKEPAAGGAVDEFAIATRLSYFLWSSMPDAALLEAAATGALRTPAGLRAQTERLLSDPKAAAFTKNFTGQWLRLRDIDFTEPDKKLYPEFDELLKASMVAETESYFDEILKGDRSVTEFIDSDWAMVNRRLAEHYGLPPVEGQEIRRVTLPKDSPRGGVLTQGAVLKVTANGTNTSPVVRGVWVLDNILGQPAPPPPPGIPAVEPDIRGTTTLREQLAKHRTVPSCAGCHSKIDPPGFALENFDVIGGWRDRYRSLGVGDRVDKFLDTYGRFKVQYKLGPPVDASGELHGGAPFKEIREFKKLVLRDKDALAGALTGKILAYALGRGMGFSDRVEIARIVGSARASNYGLRSLIHEIVQSPSFRAP
jgi:hypothetical protein